MEAVEPAGMCWSGGGGRSNYRGQMSDYIDVPCGGLATIEIKTLKLVTIMKFDNFESLGLLT